MTTIAPTCQDAESADAETPECSRPTTEPCTQGTDVTDLTAKQPGEETHVQSGISRCSGRQWGPAKRLRSSSVVSEGEKRQLTMTETMAKKKKKKKKYIYIYKKRIKASRDYHKHNTVSWGNKIGNRPGPYQ